MASHMITLVLQGVTKPVVGWGRGREEGEAEAALENTLHVLGGDSGLGVGRNSMQIVAGMGLGGANEHGGVAYVITVGVKVVAPEGMVGDSMEVV